MPAGVAISHIWCLYIDNRYNNPIPAISDFCDKHNITLRKGTEHRFVTTLMSEQYVSTDELRSLCIDSLDLSKAMYPPLPVYERTMDLKTPIKKTTRHGISSY